MKSFIALMILLASQFSIASTVDPTKIKSILAGEVYGNVVFIQVDPKPASVPGCQTNPTYSYAFNPTTEIGKVTMSMLLTAYSTGSDVFINGYDACNNNSAGVEDLRQILIK